MEHELSRVCGLEIVQSEGEGTDDEDDDDEGQTTLTWEALRPWLAAAGRKAMSTSLFRCWWWSLLAWPVCVVLV